MCSEKEFNDWKDGKLLFDKWNDMFVELQLLTEQDKIDAKEEYNFKKSTFWKEWDELTEKEKEEWYSRYAVEHNIKKCNLQTYEEWDNDWSLEHFVDTYTTKGGEKIVAFGKYGYDG
jgi:hypothetical protein